MHADTQRDADCVQDSYRDKYRRSQRKPLINSLSSVSAATASIDKAQIEVWPSPTEVEKLSIPPLDVVPRSSVPESAVPAGVTSSDNTSATLAPTVLVPPTLNPFRCPNCHDLDRTQKVSSIIAEETEHITEQTKEGERTSVKESRLASQLKPPPLPISLQLLAVCRREANRPCFSHCGRAKSASAARFLASKRSPSALSRGKTCSLRQTARRNHSPSPYVHCYHGHNYALPRYSRALENLVAVVAAPYPRYTSPYSIHLRAFNFYCWRVFSTTCPLS